MEYLFLVNHQKLQKVNYLYLKQNFILIKIYLDEDSSESEDDTKSKKSKRALNDNEFEEVPIDHRMFLYLFH